MSPAPPSPRDRRAATCAAASPHGPDPPCDAPGAWRPCTDADPAPPRRGVGPGVVLAGRYRVDRVIGRGGMGIVVKATHLQLQQPVAIKLLQPEVLHSGQVVQRFLREAQLASRLTSEHVVRVIDLGTLDGGAPFMALEYLEGEDLSRFPRAQLTIGGIVDLMLQACEALAEAHSLGIVHRDIKPANLFVTGRADRTRVLKVLDFGTSKSVLAGPLTTVHTVLGTPSYMSPEQIRSSRSVDHRSDIWSLGVVLYRLVQGVPPFDGDTFRSVAFRVVNEPLIPLAVAVPDALDEIVYRCLEKDPARRFQDVAELARALAPYAQSETQAAISTARTRRTLGRATLDRARDRESGAAVTARSRWRGAMGAPSEAGGVRWSIVAAVAVAACAIGTAAALVTAGPDPSDGAPHARAATATGAQAQALAAQGLPGTRTSASVPPAAEARVEARAAVTGADGEPVRPAIAPATPDAVTARSRPHGPHPRRSR